MKLWYPALALMGAIACNDEITGLEPPSNPATETFAPALNVNIAQMTKLPDGVYIQDIAVGSSDLFEARDGDGVVRFRIRVGVPDRHELRDL